MTQKQQLQNYKTIIVGKSSVGKSTILLRYTTGAFTQQNTTIAVDYQFKEVDVGGKKFNLELWDTAGQERYKTIVYSFFKLSKAACVVFDITSQSSLDDVGTWMEQLEVHCGKQLPKILLGNKSDLLTPANLQSQIQRITPKIQKLKKQHNCEFFVVSAKTGQNIDKAFNYIAQQIAKGIKDKKQVAEDSQQQKVTFKLDKKDGKEGGKRKEKCCG